MFKAYYSKKRFNYIHDQLLASKMISGYSNQSLIKKTGCFYSNMLNVYIDTSDGVNEDLQINEYCGRIKKVIADCQGKKFLFFKSAHSKEWSKNIEKLAKDNNGEVIPFFKWSFNDNFYNDVFKKRDDIYNSVRDEKKEYDIGYFCSLKAYDYPKPSESDNLISWPDHKNFNLPGSSKMTGHYDNMSRQKIYDIISKSKFSVLFPGSVSYKEYINYSFKCKVVLNPPGIGEYTSRMFDQCYLGNAVVMRKNTYDNGISWKSHIPEVDIYQNGWEKEMEKIIINHTKHAKNAKEYYENHWNAKSIVNYFTSSIVSRLN